MGTAVVLLIVAAILTVAVSKMVKDKKAGKCSGGCAGCDKKDCR